LVLNYSNQGIDGGWVEGRNIKGKVGLFPASYIKMLGTPQSLPVCFSFCNQEFCKNSSNQIHSKVFSCFSFFEFQEIIHPFLRIHPALNFVHSPSFSFYKKADSRIDYKWLLWDKRQRRK
jgi:hypothetical protein